MGRKKQKNKRKKNKRKQENPPVYTWQDAEGFHGLVPGERPSDEQVEQMTRVYQENIRKSPYWKKIVKMVGTEKAEELLKQCQIKVD